MIWFFFMQSMFDYKLTQQSDFATRVDIKMTANFWKKHGNAVKQISDYPLNEKQESDQFDILIYHASDETPQNIELYFQYIQAAGFLIAPGFVNNNVVDGYALEFINDIVVYDHEVDLLNTYRQAKNGTSIYSEQHPHYLVKLSRNELNFQQKIRDMLKKPYLHHCNITVDGLPAFGAVNTRNVSFAVGYEITALPEHTFSNELSTYLTRLATQEAQLVPEVSLDTDRTEDGDLKLNPIMHSVAKHMFQNKKDLPQYPATYYYYKNQQLLPIERTSSVNQPLLAIYNDLIQKNNGLTAITIPYERKAPSNKSTLGANYRIYLHTRLIYSFSLWESEKTDIFLINLPRILSAIKGLMLQKNYPIPETLQNIQNVPFDRPISIQQDAQVDINTPKFVDATIIEGKSKLEEMNSQTSSHPQNTPSRFSIHALLSMGIGLIGTGTIMWTSYVSIAPILIIIGGSMIAYGLYLMYSTRDPSSVIRQRPFSDNFRLFSASMNTNSNIQLNTAEKLPVATEVVPTLNV